MNPGQAPAVTITPNITYSASPTQALYINNLSGIDPSGLVDSTVGLNNALATFGNKGGRAYCSGARLLIDTGNLNIPACVLLEGDFSDWNGGQNISNGALGTSSTNLDYRTTVTPCIILNPSYTINMTASSGIKGVQIAVKGMQYGINNFVAPPGVMFTGTAISITATC